jgi:glycosyltransferase involved in cell wall biosynthesis
MIEISQDEIVSSWKGDIIKPLVSILCDCYNHEKFLDQTIQGFLKQKTNFPFEIIIHDDASTDTSASIIRKYEQKYPLLIKPIYQVKNQYSNKDINIWVDYTFPKALGKYIALCEGDDYWTDQDKIQKQFDFLENNDDFVICWTDYLNDIDSKITKNMFINTLPNVYPIDFDNLFNPYCTLTLTSFFKKSAIDLKKYKKMQHTKDNTLYALALVNGKGAYLNFCTSVYRIHPKGMFSLKSSFFQKYTSYLNVKELYDEIEESKTKNIKFTVDTLLKDSALEALKLHCQGNKLDFQQKDAIMKYLKQSKFSNKFKFFKIYLKNRFLSKGK